MRRKRKQTAVCVAGARKEKKGGGELSQAACSITIVSTPLAGLRHLGVAVRASCRSKPQLNACSLSVSTNPTNPTLCIDGSCVPHTCNARPCASNTKPCDTA